MRLTEQQIKLLEQAKQIIDNVNYEIEEAFGSDLKESEILNGVWCELDTLISSAREKLIVCE